MVAVNYNFLLEKGSDFQISYIYLDEENIPINLTNKCVTFSLLGDDGSLRTYSSKALSNYNTNGWSLSGDNLGNILFKLSAEETQTFNFATAVYDLDIKEIDTIKTNNIRLSEGSVSVVNRNIDLISECVTNLNPLVVTSTPVPTDPSNSLTPTPSPTEITDFCLPYDCGPLDLFSTVYNGGGLVLNDLSTTSGSVTVTNTGLISNVELAINKLNHNYHSDLVFLLAPPSGDKILLSANSKITNYSPNFSFMFSNKADNNQYLYNINNGQVCNIYDKTDIFNYNNENLLSSFSGIFGSSLTGLWTFIALDTDPVGSGFIDSWKLILTYDTNIVE